MSFLKVSSWEQGPDRRGTGQHLEVGEKVVQWVSGVLDGAGEVVYRVYQKENRLPFASYQSAAIPLWPESRSQRERAFNQRQKGKNPPNSTHQNSNVFCFVSSWNRWWAGWVGPFFTLFLQEMFAPGKGFTYLRSLVHSYREAECWEVPEKACVCICPFIWTKFTFHPSIASPHNHTWSMCCGQKSFGLPRH